MRYQVKAVKDADRVVMLPIEAGSADAAARLVEARGFGVLGVRPALDGWRMLRAGRDRFPVLLFTQELIALLEAGLTLVAALEALADKEPAENVRQVIGDLLQALRRGEGLSDALARFPQTFEPLYLATVRSNERTGGLVEALGRYCAYRVQMEQVRSKIVNAMIYPALLLVAGGGVTMLLLFHVVPKFRRIFEDMHTPLPLFSRLLVEWGRIVEDYGVVLLPATAALAVVALLMLARPQSRQRLMHKLAAVPWIDSRLRLYQSARFYRTLGMLQRSGIPLAGALDVARPVLTGPLSAAMENAAAEVRRGVAFSDAMERNGLAGGVAFRLLRVGEHSGQMPEMLTRIASFHEEQLARWVDRFTRLFEPLLMVAIGVVIGLIVIFLYMPIFEIAGSIQ